MVSKTRARSSPLPRESAESLPGLLFGAGQRPQASNHLGRLGRSFTPFEPDAAVILANDTRGNASTLGFPKRCACRLQIHERQRAQARRRRQERARRTDVEYAPDSGRPGRREESHHKVRRLSSTPAMFHNTSPASGSPCDRSSVRSAPNVLAGVTISLLSEPPYFVAPGISDGLGACLTWVHLLRRARRMRRAGDHGWSGLRGAGTA